YFDRIFDIIVGGTLVVPSMLFIFGKIDFFTGLYFSGILLVVSFFILKTQSKRVLSLVKGVFEFGMKVISKLPWLGKHFVLPDDMLRSSEGLAKMMVWMYLLSLVKLIFNALRFVVIAEAIGLSINSSDLMLFFPGAQLASVLSFTPGGLGITDWSWGGLLYAMGVSKAEIVPYLVSFRLVISASLVVLLGVSTLFYGRVGSRG
ncbi:MAG: lysylphosphatidylglycerol synthase domain-containing protein, partial [bacterium]